jgi:signal peptidase I
MTTKTAYDYHYRWQPRSPRGRAARALVTTFCVACLLLASLMILPWLFGYQRYVITSGSMTGTYDRGSLVYADVVPVSDLGVGDVITYTPPAGSGPDGLVTHRIVSIERDQFGRPLFRTKGDANPTADPWTFTLDDPTQARAVFNIPYVGYVVSLLSIREARMAAIGIPALLIAFAVLVGFRREVRQTGVAPEARS